MSRMNPIAFEATLTVLGWTYSSWASTQFCSLRSRPRPSPRTDRTGPMVMMPRRRVGTVKISVNSDRPVRMGTANWARAAPTGTSMTEDAQGRFDVLTTDSSPTADSSTTTRWPASFSLTT